MSLKVFYICPFLTAQEKLTRELNNVQIQNDQQQNTISNLQDKLRSKSSEFDQVRHWSSFRKSLLFLCR